MRLWQLFHRRKNRRLDAILGDPLAGSPLVHNDCVLQVGHTKDGERLTLSTLDGHRQVVNEMIFDPRDADELVQAIRISADIALARQHQLRHVKMAKPPAGKVV